MKNYLDILKKIDIIIFINDKDNPKIKTELIKQKITLLDKEIIYCINKVDLLPIGLKENTKKKYLNQNGNNEPLFISALSGEGIKELKEKINEIGNKIIEKRNKQKGIDDTTNSISRQSINNLEEAPQSRKTCQNEINKFFEFIKKKFK